ncbi:hypothetical protein HW130_29060 [Streptomyces sp. PKU-EA00015]|uniref:hypothetical protein n=1 Tax=Streptomyces sp. PKU-EA00015 TaxID=2748326 RepID=UPI0015A1379C|nr:hypothetical protein [Streptomyces sp. PKU-EA00015]NWF30259.1 hypothetical protein [Streptomyces sp. PKU-EA00015]
MSELLTAAAVIVPFVSSAATSFAGAVVDSAQSRLADSAVERGRVLLGRVLHRGADDPPRTEQDAVAAATIEELSPDDREILEGAIGEWMTDGDDLSARSLRTQIEIAHREYHAGDRIQVTSHGDGSPAIGKLDTANFYFNPRPDQGGSS